MCIRDSNYTGYCNEGITRLIEQQSQEVDPAKRRALVWQIQTRLENEAYRPIMGWRTDHFAHHPHVKGLTIHNVVYNLSLIHISEPTRLLSISYAVFCLK